MSGHFSRLVYDKCFINEETKQSTKVGDYKLYDGQTDNENSCHSVFGPRCNRVGNSSEVDKGTDFGDRAELESALSNRGVPASRCQQNRLLDDKKKQIAKDLQRSVYCDKFLNPTSSRLEKPIDEFRGLSTLPLQIDYPLINPNESVFNGHNSTSLVNQDINSRLGTFTRLEAKDEYGKKFIDNKKVETK
jgi:hypothetical protein